MVSKRFIINVLTSSMAELYLLARATPVILLEGKVIILPQERHKHKSNFNKLNTAI